MAANDRNDRIRGLPFKAVHNGRQHGFVTGIGNP